jgi:hypothetical protein
MVMDARDGYRFWNLGIRLDEIQYKVLDTCRSS